MKEVIYHPIVETLRGEVFPSLVCRQKRLHACGTNHLGKNEIYYVRKRNYTLHPLTEGEQRTVNLFREAERRRKQELQVPARTAYWQARFSAQSVRPEPGNTKIYHRLDAFMRAMLMREIKASGE